MQDIVGNKDEIPTIDEKIVKEDIDKIEVAIKVP
jgi:hypothetical protein